VRAVDTNVLVRFLIGDDPAQAQRARAVVGQEPIFVPRSVILEAEWVLRGVYDLPKSRVIAALRAFAGLPSVAIEDSSLVAKALDWAEAGMDFADALHLASAATCDAFLTFDKQLVRSGTKLGGVPVLEP
jgi:predicted nucleic-acid-binding protein